MSLRRWVACFDNHGARGDPDACSAFFDFIDVWRPHKKLHGGDLFDFTPIRRGASESEKHESMGEDISEGRIFLKRYHPDVFLRGNHDERLWDRLNDTNGLIRDLAEESVRNIEQDCGRMHCEILPYDKGRGVYELGDLKIVHGFYFGKFAAARHASTYGHALFGHTHAFGIGVEARWGGNDIAYNVPCLCDLHPDYNRGQGDSLRWEHGWAYGVLDEKTGATEVWICRKVAGKWLYPSEMISAA